MDAHLRHRELDPATGVFLSPDPLDGLAGYATVTNGYHYAHNDPFGYVDPLGLRPWSDRDARCWVLLGSCGEVAGEAWQATLGAAEGLWGVAGASVAVVHDPLVVADGVRETYTDAEGGWWGVYEAASLLNPVNHLLAAGDACLQANRGSVDPRAAGRACTELTVTVAGSITGGKGLATTRPPTAPRPAAPNTTRASTPTGSRGTPGDTPGGPLQISTPAGAAARNTPATIGGRRYSGHALDRMQGQGITPSVVDNAITSGSRVPGKVPGTTAHYDGVNDLTVIVDARSGRVVTVDYGWIGQ